MVRGSIFSHLTVVGSEANNDRIKDPDLLNQLFSTLLSF